MAAEAEKLNIDSVIQRLLEGETSARQGLTVHQIFLTLLFCYLKLSVLLFIAFFFCVRVYCSAWFSTRQECTVIRS